MTVERTEWCKPLLHSAITQERSLIGQAKKAHYLNYTHPTQRKENKVERPMNHRPLLHSPITRKEVREHTPLSRKPLLHSPITQEKSLSSDATLRQTTTKHTQHSRKRTKYRCHSVAKHYYIHPTPMKEVPLQMPCCS